MQQNLHFRAKVGKLHPTPTSTDFRQDTGTAHFRDRRTTFGYAQRIQQIAVDDEDHVRVLVRK